MVVQFPQFFQKSTHHTCKIRDMKNESLQRNISWLIFLQRKLYHLPARNEEFNWIILIVQTCVAGPEQ